MIKEWQAARDLETIPMTRGQLVALLVRVYVAEGKTVADSEYLARVQVDATFLHLHGPR